jgi:hypothetical protein
MGRSGLGFDGDGEAFGLELFLVEFGALFVGGEEKGEAALVGFEHAVHGVLAIEGGELDNRLDDEEHFVFVVVVEKNFPAWELLGRGFGRDGLGAGSRHGGGASAFVWRSVELFPLLGHVVLIGRFTTSGERTPTSHNTLQMFDRKDDFSVILQ